MAQGSEEPPFLKVGTEVSAKYRGAFCEASIKIVKKHVKCKIQYKDNTTATLTDDVVKGDLKIGSNVEVKTPDGKIMDGVIIKLTDASAYTVVFDDGDERTLRRSSLCLKGERHFNESETLDHLPLTDPENFGTPVMQNGKKRKKRRPSQHSSNVDDAGSEKEDSAPVPSKKKCLYNDSIVGKVVVVERGTRRKSHWFPALGVSPSPENMVYIKSKDQCVVRSFKDGNYHVVNVRDTKEFSKDQDPVSSAVKSDNRASKPAIERAIAYIETGRIPSIWEGNKSEVISHDDDDDSRKSASSKSTKVVSSDDETDEDAERDAFTEKLQNFMEENGTPIVRHPILGNQDLDLHRLYSLVKEAGGMEEVTRQQQWRTIYSKMGIAIMPPSASHHIKMAYKKYLQSFEVHETGGSTGGSGKDSDEEKSDISTSKNVRTRHERNSKALTRQGTIEKNSADKRAKNTNVEKVEEKPSKPASSKSRRSSTPNKPVTKPAAPVSTSNRASNKPPVPNKLPLSNISTTNTSKATTPTGKTGAKSSLSRHGKPSTPETIKDDEEKKEIKVDNENGEGVKTEEPGNGQKSLKRQDSIESDIDVDEEVTSPESELAVDVVNSPGCMSDTSESKSETRSEAGTEEVIDCVVGDKIQVKYGRGRNRRLYEAKVVTIDPDAEEGLLYLIHYTGWNIRYDEWISPDRIVCKSNNKLPKKKGATTKELPRSKLPPKPLGKQYARSNSKRGTKSPSPSSPSSKPGDAKTNHGNGSKASPRNSPSPPQIDSSMSSPASTASTNNSSKSVTKAGTPGRRTRSERSSSVSNGLEEAVKSPPSRRRQKADTPEPTEKQSSEKIIEAPLAGPTHEGSKDCSETNHKEATESHIKKENEIKLESKDQDCIGNSLSSKLDSINFENSSEQDSLNCSTNKTWSKLPNGLTSYSSSESGSPDHSTSDNDMEPTSKKIKLENEKDLGTENIQRLLDEDVEHKSPVVVPYFKGNCSSEEQEESESSHKEDREDKMKDSDSKEKDNTSEIKNSSGPESSKESTSPSVSKEESKSEKKDDHRNRKHRKKKEKKKHRRHSINDNNSDGPGSPNVAHSPSSKGSPTRPKICFDADLETIKSMEDSTERIRLLQLKINEMRKVYGSLKAEVASIDRKRKKLKKKREEDAASHESNSKPSHSNHVTSSPAPVECR